ncbi:hypothetical protein [Tautonia plasticadhaerens]|uniref:Uncharacterized protein n=1 Tax=Tautonia plasticadhaerens TaxID=2527974 RepID=A0A518H9P6_9BACT|nr:hypothetical protein [Tautonia plasticadhaerens]QDV37569.1 hypothetical protein ElP_55090 [Tautonia plasticadhaerens]
MTNEGIEGRCPGGEQGRTPASGGYYWLPRPEGGSITWEVVTCHDLGHDAAHSHRELWPALVRSLAGAWGLGTDEMGRLLEDRYYGLPRGRVTRPGGKWMILHGEDAPVADWLPPVLAAFRLDGRPIRVLSDDHERTLSDDRWRVEEALGITIGGQPANGAMPRDDDQDCPDQREDDPR